jgi:hypothetical protein
VKFETTPGFDNDYRRLEREHADTFKRVVREKFAPADARATFELITVDGELRCRWCRLGDHDVFKNP